RPGGADLAVIDWEIRATANEQSGREAEHLLGVIYRRAGKPKAAAARTRTPPIRVTRPPTASVASESRAPRTASVAPAASRDHQLLLSPRAAGAVRTVASRTSPRPIRLTVVPRTPSSMRTAPTP